MPNRNDPGFSNEFAVQAGFPSSGEMQQRAGQGGLPPQRQQMPFEHKRAPATNQAVPYVQPVMQGTPAAQGSQYQVRQQQISPGVASFLRANAIDQGARGVEQRLGQIENQMQGMSSPRDAAVGSMAQMRAGRDTQQPQRAPAAVSQAADMMQAQALGGQTAVSPGQAFDPRTGVGGAGQMARDHITYQQATQDFRHAKARAEFEHAKRAAEQGFARGQAGEAPGMRLGAMTRGGFPTALPPGMQLGALTGGMPIVPQQRVSDVEQMRRGIAPAVAPIQPGVAPAGAQMPDIGMMNAMFPQGFVPTPIEDRMAFVKGGPGREEGRELEEKVDERAAKAAERAAKAQSREEGGVYGWDAAAPGVGDEPGVPGEEGLGEEGPGEGEPGEGEGGQAPPIPEDDALPEEYEEYGSDVHGKSAGDVPYTAGSIATQMEDISNNLGKLGDKITKGILENAKQQVQKQKDYLHSALSEAGGGILAGGAPLLAQESITAVKALLEAEYQAAKAEVAIYTAQAGILGNLLGQENKVKLANAALDFAKKQQANLEDRQDWQEWSWEKKFDYTEKYNQDLLDKGELDSAKANLVTAINTAPMYGLEGVMDADDYAEFALVLQTKDPKKIEEYVNKKLAETKEETEAAENPNKGKDASSSGFVFEPTPEYAYLESDEAQEKWDAKQKTLLYEQAKSYDPDEEEVLKILNKMSPEARKQAIKEMTGFSYKGGDASKGEHQWNNLLDAMDDESYANAFYQLMGVGDYEGKQIGHSYNYKANGDEIK